MEQLSNKKRIFLHGNLKHLHEGVIEVYADSPAEAIHGMCHQLPELSHLKIEERPVIQIVGFNTRQSIYEKTDVEELHLVPAFIGAKGGGLFKIVLGAVLIAAAFALGGPAAGTLATTLFSMGTSMILGGLLELLTPAPKRDSGTEGATDPDASKYLGAPGNTVKAGTRIPLIYGEFRVYGHYMSFNIDATEVQPQTTTGATG